MGIKRPLIILGSTVGAVASVLSYHPAAGGSAAPLSNALEPVTDGASSTATPLGTPTDSAATTAPTPAPSTPTPTPTTTATPSETSKPAPSTSASKPPSQTKKSSGSGTAANSTTNSSSAESSTSAPASTPESAPSAPTSAPSSSGKVAKDQTVTGATSQTRWGPVQVQITVKDGKIVDAVGLQYPNGDRRSQWISDQAIPWLVEETLSEQIANVQIIGGATYTSLGWRQSLASAMQKAGL